MNSRMRSDWKRSNADFWWDKAGEGKVFEKEKEILEKGVLNHMGYCTWFSGNLKLDKALAPHHFAYLRAFHTAEHVHWDVDLLKNDPDPIREAVELPLGENGCYFTGPRAQFDRFFNLPGEPIPYDYSYPPLFSNGRAKRDPAYLGSLCPGKPDHHCGWAPGDDGTALVAAVDKFYGYIEWLHYLLDHFLVPWGYVLGGKMSWQGEDENDVGTILVENNVITILKIKTLNEPAGSVRTGTTESFVDEGDVHFLLID